LNIPLAKNFALTIILSAFLTKPYVFKYVYWTKANARDTRDTDYLEQEDVPVHNDCSRVHEICLSFAEGVHTKTDRRNDIQLQSYVEFDSQRFSGDY